MRLKEKVAIITGSTNGIGRAAARLFAREGAKVVLNGRRQSRGEDVLNELQNNGYDSIFVRGDVSVSEEAKNIVDSALSRYGRIDILYNNAGVWDKEKDGTLVDIDEDDWDRIIALNLKSTYLMCKYTIPHMVAQKNGSIINTASIVALLGLGDRDAYCAAKSAIISLNKSVAAKYGHSGIRSNVIYPGSVRTDMVDNELLKDPEILKNWITVCPIPRVGEPEEIANLALFLASDESSFITGTDIVADGGYMIVP